MVGVDNTKIYHYITFTVAAALSCQHLVISTRGFKRMAPLSTLILMAIILLTGKRLRKKEALPKNRGKG